MSNAKNRSSDRLLVKKSYSLKFDEINLDTEKIELKKIKSKERNSLDNLSNSLIENLSESNSSSVSFNEAKSSFMVKSPFKIFEDKKLLNAGSNDVEIQCDLDNENCLKDSDLNEEEMELKAKNPNNYWKLIAEKLRVDLYDNLQENMEVRIFLKCSFSFQTFLKFYF